MQFPTRFILAISIVIVIVAAALIPRRDYSYAYGSLFQTPPWFQTPLYKAEVSLQVRRSQQIDGAVVFIGDSNVVALATSNIAPKTENFGIGGDGVNNVSDRLPFYNLSRARDVVIQTGINNWSRDGFAGFDTKYAAMLSKIPAGVPVVAMAIFPANRRSERTFSFDGLLDAIAHANREIEAACHARPRCTYLNINAEISNADGSLRDEYAMEDGIHLSPAGLMVWSDALKRKIH